MSDNEIRYPQLDLLYQRYLTDENSASFIHAVSKNYTLGTLERLARFGNRITRRAAVLAIGFVGDYSANEVMGVALCDHDRAVRLLADHGIREVWQRQGTEQEQAALKRIHRLVAQSSMHEALEEATKLIFVNDEMSEAWSQRAIARCALGDFEGAISDCRSALDRNEYHFPAAMGLAHCYLQLDDAFSALEGFRLSLKINPDLEGVRGHISHLERILEEG